MTKLSFASFGFTLIEILIVMAIIAILVGLIGTGALSALRRGRDAQRKADLKNIQTALRVYYNDVNRYPCDNTSFQIRACSASANCDVVQSCTWGEPWAVGSATYMTKLPRDPLKDRDYRYDQVDTETYVLSACLENTNDPQCVAVTGDWCIGLGGCTYELRN